MRLAVTPVLSIKIRLNSAEMHPIGTIKGRSIFTKKACDGNVYEACSDLGVIYFDGKGVKKYYKRAAELFNKACNGGYADGCSNLGVMYEHGEGVKMDITRAMGYYRRACDAGV